MATISTPTIRGAYMCEPMTWDILTAYDTMEEVMDEDMHYDYINHVVDDKGSDSPNCSFEGFYGGHLAGCLAIHSHGCSSGLQFVVYNVRDRPHRRIVLPRGGHQQVCEQTSNAFPGPAALWMSFRSASVSRKANTQSSSRGALASAQRAAAEGDPQAGCVPDR